ncbi:hypothetical protein BKI52_13220 [marine bacterium AO1-C]|nr:hypothetical protein BKI52_13220 [marine bacterium AO1-C]
MEFDLDKTLEILERTPQVLKTLLQNLPTEWTHHNEGENTWSPFDVIGHLIHGEKTDWVVRAQVILSNSDDKTFAPFDRFAQFEASKGKTLEELLETFAQLRSENLTKLRAMNISESDLQKEGTHPALGKATLKQLLSTWTVHDLGHIAQISRVMAKQYASEVGVWSEYLGILK